jgi:hypothetical protein
MIPAKPQKGMIIRYSFAWAGEDADVDSNKVRPAMLVVVLEGNRVVALPITHSAPRADQEAMEIPPALKTTLGLDGERSWIRLTEGNIFTWVGYDIVPTEHYPIAPDWFVKQVSLKYLQLLKAKRINRPTDRD